MDWFTRVLYLGSILAILLLGAIALYILFLLYGTHYDVEEAENKQHSVVRVDKRRCSKCKHCLGIAALDLKGPNSNSNSKAAKTPKQPDIVASIPTRQLMFSSLKQSAKDSDVVLATAMSSIPLKELGGFNNDIVVDVSQQVNLNKDELNSEKYSCLLCKNRNEITWSDVKCFAQTTIGVLVYKRAFVSQKSIVESESLVKRDSEASKFFDKHQTDSTLTLAPVPDSRITIKQSQRGTESTTAEPARPTTAETTLPSLPQ